MRGGVIIGLLTLAAATAAADGDPPWAGGRRWCTATQIGEAVIDAQYAADAKASVEQDRARAERDHAAASAVPFERAKSDGNVVANETPRWLRRRIAQLEALDRRTRHATERARIRRELGELARLEIELMNAIATHQHLDQQSRLLTLLVARIDSRGRCQELSATTTYDDLKRDWVAHADSVAPIEKELVAAIALAQRGHAHAAGAKRALARANRKSRGLTNQGSALVRRGLELAKPPRVSCSVEWSEQS